MGTYKIVHKQILAQGIKRIDVSAPAIAAKTSPGQFVMVMPDEKSHNIPMAIVDSDDRRGVISLIVHEVGPSTKCLGELSIGDTLHQMVGPLGVGPVLDKFGLVVCVATGIGAAQILPICRGLKKSGNKVIGIVGAKSKKVLMLEAQMRVVCDEMFITTNDGSYERKGLATDLLKELLTKYAVDRVYAIGSVDMMHAASQMTKAQGIPLRVMVNPRMTNGLGLCGACRVKVGGEYRFACTEGPHFDGHLLDFDDLSKHMNALESQVWNHRGVPISPKKLGFQTFVKLLWAMRKK